MLHKPVAFLIMPIFALANTGIVIATDWIQHLAAANSLGIILGLSAGKPLGITLACIAAVSIGVCRLPDELNWRHIIGVSMLGGIGFTMSIFIANLAFVGAADVINESKMAIFCASLISGIVGYTWLRLAANGRSPTAR